MLLGGHLDTVPANGNATPRRDGQTLHGLGTADMKGGLAIMLTLAEALGGPGRRRPASTRTFVFYVGEEIAEEWNGLRDLFDRAPELVAGDLAILLEPTDGWVEAGCQGTLHVRATYRGARAHTARPWMGENAIHRAAGSARARRRRRSRHRRRRRSGVPAVAAGRPGRGRRRQQCRARRVQPRRQPSVRPERRAPTRPRPRRARWWPTPTRSRCSTRRSPHRRTCGTRWSPSWWARSTSACARSSAGPTSRASRPPGCPRSTSVPATRRSPTPPRSGCTRESLEGCHAVLGRFLGVA